MKKASNNTKTIEQLEKQIIVRSPLVRSDYQLQQDLIDTLYNHIAMPGVIGVGPLYYFEDILISMPLRYPQLISTRSRDIIAELIEIFFEMRFFCALKNGSVEKWFKLDFVSYSKHIGCLFSDAFIDLFSSFDIYYINRAIVEACDICNEHGSNHLKERAKEFQPAALRLMAKFHDYYIKERAQEKRNDEIKAEIEQIKSQAK